MAMDYTQTLAALAEMEGQEVSVAISPTGGAFVSMLVVHGKLGAVEMVPQVKPGHHDGTVTDKETPPEERDWEKGVPFYSVGDGRDWAIHGRPGFFLDPDTFEKASKEGWSINLTAADLRVQVLEDLG
jgi:hypothetical protein